MAPVTWTYLQFPSSFPTNRSLTFTVFFVDSYRIPCLYYPVFFSFNTYSHIQETNSLCFHMVMHWSIL